MPKHDMDVVVHTTDGGEPIEFDSVDYVSFVNSDTYGIPAILTESRFETSLPGTIVYVNVNNVAAVEVERRS